MAIGGNQGISVKRILAQDWMSVPIMADTPVAPLTGSGWPGKGYLVFVAQNPDSVCVGCPPADTSLWEYTGARWKRVGMDYLTKLVYGGDVGRQTNRRYFVTPYAAFINGNYYTTINNTNVTTAAKTADSTSRIDVIVITTSGPTVKVGIPNKIPFKPPVAGDEIELSTIYFPPFDTTAKFIPSTAIGVTNIFRVEGRDSIYFSIDTVTLAIKDSIGISKNDTATMLNNYKFTAANGLTKDSTVFRLGGSLNQNTNINLNNRRLSFVSAAGDTSLRITTQGRLLLNTTDTTSNHIFYSNGRSRILSLEVTQGDNAGRTGQGIRIDGTDRTFGFQGSGGLFATDMFKYSTWVNDTSTVSLGSSPTVARNIISIYTGFSKLISCGASSDTTRANVLNIAPRYVFNCDSSRNLVRGIYYNPSIVNINRTNHVAYENTTGTNLLNSVSGSTRIGYNTFDTTYRLDVNGGVKTDSVIVDDLYAKFGRYLGDGSTPFAPIEFRATSGNRARIDLRPASNGGWNSNWYGAITHNGPETDILAANYGSLYLGSSFWSAGSGIYLGNTRNNPSMFIRNNNNVLIGDTANTGFRFDVNGRVRLRDTLTLSTTPVTADTSANDLLVINSSNGQVRRFTGAFPSANPTLQQVTTAGKTTTDTIKANAFRIPTVIGTDVIFSDDGQAYRAAFKIAGFSDYAWIRGQYLELIYNGNNSTLSNIYSTKNNNIYLPDSSGTLTQRVAINGTTYNTAVNGVVDIGDLWLSGSDTLDFPSTGHGNSADLTFTLTGAAEGDVVALGIPNASIVANGSFIAWVSATNTITVRFNNYASSGSSDPASGTFKIKVLK
jgi:hypothetical protein